MNVRPINPQKKIMMDNLPPTGEKGEWKMTREEHLAWCKKRALEYVDMGQVQSAFASMASDLNTHPETEGHFGIQLGMLMLMGGHLNTPEKMRNFIEGFN